MRKHQVSVSITFAVFSICATLGFAADAPNPARTQPGKVLKGSEAFGDWRADAPGVRRLIRVEDLPRPFATASADKPPDVVSRPKETWPKAPSGFKVELFEEGLTNPRKIVTAPNGDLFVAESEADRVRVIRQRPDGSLGNETMFATGLRQPFGIAFYPPGPRPEYVYVANTGSVVRFAYSSGDLRARRPAEVIVPDLSAGGHLTGGGHWTRDVVFMPDGKKMFVSVGSRSNNDDGPTEKNRANILEYNPDGSGFRIYASGIRNAVGLAIHPTTGQLWASVNERDGLGDDLVPDYITHIQEGGFYGWPWWYMGGQPDPKYNGRHPELKDKVITPDVLVQSHSASLCMTFYTADQFPKEYQGDAFAAEHGSWNRNRRTGYKVIRVPIKNGKATGEYEDFLTGFVTPAGEVWGRPVGITVDKTGALIVSDDGGNCLWRVSYVGANAGKEGR